MRTTLLNPRWDAQRSPFLSSQQHLTYLFTPFLILLPLAHRALCPPGCPPTFRASPPDLLYLIPPACPNHWHLECHKTQSLDHFFFSPCLKVLNPIICSWLITPRFTSLRPTSALSSRLITPTATWHLRLDVSKVSQLSTSKKWAPHLAPQVFLQSFPFP